jgi:hypothetical protein
MSGATFASVDAFGLLKELYSDEAEYQDNITSSFYNFLRHASSGEVEFDGKYWNEGVVLQLNESYAAINDNERLPDASFQKGVFAKYRPKLMYSSIEMTTYAATRGHDKGRVGGKYIEDTVKGTFMTFNSNLDFDSLGNGRGYRATVATATPAASSFTVDFSTRLRSGMNLDWYDSTLTTKRGSISIDLQGIDRMARQVYIDPTFGTGAVPAGATADDVLVVFGALNAGEPTDGRYMAGYDYITDNTVSLGTLSAATYKLWAATNVNAGLANPNQEILQQHWDALWIISNTVPNKMAFNPAWKRGYLNGFLNQRRFTSNSFDTGASSLSFSPVRMGKDENASKKTIMLDMLEDKNMDPSKVNIFSDSAFCIAHDYGDNPHLADEDGSDFRFRRNYDSLNGFVRFWSNSVVKRRNAIGQIYNFSVVSGVI